MIDSIKLSICIATFKRSNFIGETLDSILLQLTNDVELIVVDGASPDDTPQVMQGYLMRFPNIRYYRELENSGIDKDYDKAVTYAKGEFCWLMTDDDIVIPGAISRIISTLNGSNDLLVINSEIRNADLTKLIAPKILNFSEDKQYGLLDSEIIFSELANCLSFIGSVVIRRTLWLERNRSYYNGTLFAHVGVIFQHPPILKILVIANPLIIIRYGNAMWTPRGFEIWMFKWPQLIWSFEDFSAHAKSLVCAKEPWRLLKKLALYRGTGAYTLNEYNRFLSHERLGASKIMAYLVAIIPAYLANFLISLYYILFNRKAFAGVYDLSRCSESTWPSRLAARILKV